MDKKEIKNKILVNSITGIRLIGTFALFPIYIHCGAVMTALCAAIFFVTDLIDGKLARNLNVQCFFGSLMDGMSDKAMSLACLFILAYYRPIFVIPIVLEPTIIFINYRSALRGNNVKSSFLGKAKTFVLGFSVVSGFLTLESEHLIYYLNNHNINTFTTLLSSDPSVLSKMVALPLIISEGIVILDYMRIAYKQDKKRINKKIDKEKYELKTKTEIMHALFDTKFYIENKDKGIKQLIYKKKKQ